MNMNPMQLMGLLKGKNPQEMAMSMIKNSNINDPMINQLLQFAQSGDINSMNKIAENFFKGQGLDFNNEFNNFMSMLK
ncbi:MAG: hypothetical protein ACI39B_06845 [Methanobrevibacter smithii]|jgi:hypothetical protein